MKAVIYTSYGLPDVLRIADVEKPVPSDYEVLIKVHAAGFACYPPHCAYQKEPEEEQCVRLS